MGSNCTYNLEADFQIKRRSFMAARSFINSSSSILADSNLGNTPDLPSENTTWVPIGHIYSESNPIRVIFLLFNLKLFIFS